MKIAEIILPHTPTEDIHFRKHMASLYQIKLEQGWLRPITTLGKTTLVGTNWPPEFHTIFFFLQNDTPIGFAILARGGRERKATDWFSVTMIWIEQQYRNQSIAMSFYNFLQSQGIELQPDTKQSIGGTAIWNRLRSKNP